MQVAAPPDDDDDDDDKSFYEESDPFCAFQDTLTHAEPPRKGAPSVPAPATPLSESRSISSHSSSERRHRIAPAVRDGSAAGTSSLDAAGATGHRSADSLALHAEVRRLGAQLNEMQQLLKLIAGAQHVVQAASPKMRLNGSRGETSADIEC